MDGFGSYVQGNLAPMEKLMPAVNRLAFGEHTPSYPSSCFVAPNASVIGQVTMGAGSSIWYGATVRADVNTITIGELTNIQDRAVIHVARNNPSGDVLPTTIGSKVTVGHGAILHACTIEDEVLIGMGAKILDGAVVKQGAIVAAGSVVTPGTEVPAGQVWMGMPARYMRDVDPAESSFLGLSAHNYSELAKGHWNEFTKVHLKVMHDDMLKQDAMKRDPNEDEQLGLVRDHYSREITRGPMDGGG